MNFGIKAADAVVEQQPTYHQAPNFTTRPFPNGPYELGTIVRDIKQFWPLNEGDERIPIPRRYSDVKEDITANVSKSLSGETGIIAKILDRSVGGDVNLSGEKSDDDLYHFEKLETVYFFPKPKYLSDCVTLSDVKDHLEGSNYKTPVYLITGLKLAWGTSIEMTRGRDLNANANVIATIPGDTVNATVEANAAMEGKSAISTKHSKPADFVVGIQVMKLYHSKSPFNKEPRLKSKSETRGAVLVDDDDDDTKDDEDKVIIADLDDEDMQGMKRELEIGLDGNNVVWLVRSA